jgi:sec-independent protein translocase protein TatC
VRLPADFSGGAGRLPNEEDKLVVRTAVEPFSLYLQVSLYAAFCLSVPFLLWQVWGFIAPGLYPHERGWALPFVVMSSLSFVAGAAFAYYVLFPPAITYLLGLGSDFRLFLNASDYFDFIIIVMLAMGVVFQMPAATYVLSRIGLVDARFLVAHWRVSSVVILVAAAVLSPTSDVPNMMLFAAPMVVLYLVSILVAWLFARPRKVA